MQIDVSMGEPVLDSYTFGDEHCAARELRNLPAAISGETDTEKLVYLGGYAYCLLGETDEEGNTEVYDVLHHTETAFDRPAAVKAYEEDVAIKRQMRAEEAATRSSTMSTRGANTITKFVQGYTSKPLATYNNVADSSHAGCAAIAGTNICMYWAADRGKSKLVQTMKSTFDELFVDMKIKSTGSFQSSGGTSENAFSGLKTYVQRKGYTVSTWGKAPDDTFKWAWITTRIDRGMPIAVPVFYAAPYQEGYDGTRTWHGIAVFGYQYIEVENTVLLADAYHSTLVYKTLDSLYYKDCNCTVKLGEFAFYIGL